jgi:hypothetical protein
MAAVAVFAAASSAAASPRAAQSPLHLLDVPYMSQSEALCGGAAVAMVMRYWGVTDVYAETFAPLVDNAVGGIRGEELLRMLRLLGWTAESFRGDAALIQQHLSARRPVVVLLEDRPGRFHYVVVVGWSSRRVIVHDPARSPFRILDEQIFSDAWRASDFWTLVATPVARVAGHDLGAGSDVREPPPEATVGSTGAGCLEMIEEGVRLSGAGDAAGAGRLFELAAEACPDSAAPYREMAGLSALKSDWPSAGRLARRAIALDRTDSHAWRILATSRYLEGDQNGALSAWNAIGEPVVDLVSVHGLQRTRYGVVTRFMGLVPQTVLATGELKAAERRLTEFPSAQTSRVTYRPGEAGRVQIEAVVLERPVLPTSKVSLVAMGARTVTDREVRFNIAAPTGGGELWTAAWRWWAHRPGFSAGYAAPAPFGGVWAVNVFDERQSYAGADAPVIEERRRGATFQASNWSARGFRWEVGAGVDHWRGAGRAMVATVGGQQRFADNGFIEGRAGAWAGGVRTWTFALRSGWRSSARGEPETWLLHGGVDLAGSRAPLALWAGAGTGPGREVLLRAHPLLDDGVIRDAVLGRRLVHGGVEWRHQLPPVRRVLKVAPALFLDAAQAAHRGPSFDGRLHLDAGAGLRIAVPGAGMLRFDLARGLRDGAMAFSAGWTK